MSQKSGSLLIFYPNLLNSYLNYKYLPYTFILQSLTQKQTRFHGRDEGLALVYESKGRGKEALLLIEHALTLAKGFFEEGTLDQEILDEIEEEKRKILDMR
jgi:hypothetical protein